MTLVVMAVCGALCAGVFAYVLAPVRMQKHVLAIAMLSALASLGLYMTLGRPDLPAQTRDERDMSAREYRETVLQEFTLMERLSRNPDDADAMIRLAAVRMMQGRAGSEVERLLDRAEALRPTDPRIKDVRKIYKAMAPDAR